ncbi:MAG: plasmid pRiA4b ORF-3 family protein, partial [Acetobacteraceae bacterium]
MEAARIVHLRIRLDEVKPAVMRRIEVPLTIRLDRLHLVLQAAMGWSNSHLYEIRAHDGSWGMPDPNSGDGPRDASKVRLEDVLKDAGVKSLKYLYDFGDSWEHSLRIERIADAEPGIAYPRLVEAVGRCPPEDVGGAWGYGDFLEALADP